ncbi:hypothetical protein [Candidatus Sulfurimonas baltica]|uniref:Cysteine-rich small domain-containing protein n=1 Tax=Candidatus Sulfurimonas baltica TaxID=2740404 RepID=A0A7S7LVP9_9BACT|nr:hypothetical protein [Candidatus Sulfurimonas baltica]QOY52192.1 hypothetical protein HUE88_00390 [Candidatus Sulfurimonas baltica]
MSYKSWFDAHADKHKKIVDRLVAKGFSKEEIIEYFYFDNMVQHERDFCPLYEDNKKCHDMSKLNCYLCACPNFRFNDEGLGTYNELKILSKCDINNGEEFASGKSIHQDCSKCTVPHHKAYVEKHFDLDWKKIMKECEI